MAKRNAPPFQDQLRLDHERTLAREALLRRWLTAIGLLVAAEDQQRRESSASLMTAAVVADAANELLLRTITSWAAKSTKAESSFHQVLEAAREGSEAAGRPFPAGLDAALLAGRQTRNGAAHHGVVPARVEVDQLTRAGRRLLAHLHALARVFGEIPEGAGVATALASTIDAPELTASLREADAHLSREDPTSALDAAALSLHRASQRLHPSLPSGGELIPARLRDFEEVLQPVTDRVVSLERWVLPLALGLRPAEYERLTALLGDVFENLSGEVRVTRQAEPSMDEAFWALDQVVLIVFRLRETGSLLEGPLIDALIRRSLP